MIIKIIKSCGNSECWQRLRVWVNVCVCEIKREKEWKKSRENGKVYIE